MLNLGQRVRIKSDGKEGAIISINIDDKGTRYTISSKEVDLQAGELYFGVKHLMEDEVEEVTGEL